MGCTALRRSRSRRSPTAPPHTQARTGTHRHRRGHSRCSSAALPHTHTLRLSRSRRSPTAHPHTHTHTYAAHEQMSMVQQTPLPE